VVLATADAAMNGTISARSCVAGQKSAIQKGFP